MTAQTPRRNRLEVDEVGGVTLARFTDRKLLDEQNIINVRDHLFHLVDEDGVRRLALDFATVEFASSAFFGALIWLHKKLQVAGGQLVLYGISSEVYEAFEITKMNRMFTIVRDEVEALARFDGVSSEKIPLVLGCPIAGCSGTSHVEYDRASTDPLRIYTWETTCPDCGARFSARGRRPMDSRTARVQILKFAIPTFDNEWVAVDVSVDAGEGRNSRKRTVSVAQVKGRLELFCRDALERAWQTLSTPRRVLFDLRGATRTSDQGARIILDLCSTSGEENRAVLLIDPSKADQARLVSEGSTVFVDRAAAVEALGP